MVWKQGVHCVFVDKPVCVPVCANPGSWQASHSRAKRAVQARLHRVEHLSPSLQVSNTILQPGPWPTSRKLKRITDSSTTQRIAPKIPNSAGSHLSAAELERHATDGDQLSAHVPPRFRAGSVDRDRASEFTAIVNDVISLASSQSTPEHRCRNPAPERVQSTCLKKQLCAGSVTIIWAKEFASFCFSWKTMLLIQTCQRACPELIFSDQNFPENCFQYIQKLSVLFLLFQSDIFPNDFCARMASWKCNNDKVSPLFSQIFLILESKWSHKRLSDTVLFSLSIGCCDTVRSGAEERRFWGSRLDVLIFRLRSYHVLISYSAECIGPKFHKTLMFLGQAGTFLSFQARRSSAKRSSTSDLTVARSHTL